MNITINKNNETPLYIQMKQEIKEKIISSELPSGFKLPSERSLADEMNVSRNTVVKTYQSLIDEGLIVISKKPKGYFVRETVQFKARRIFSPLSKMIKYTYTEKENLFDELFDQSNSQEYVSFAGISMDSGLCDRYKGKYDMFYRFDSRETERLKGNICKLLSKQNISVGEKNVQVVSEAAQAIEYVIDLYLTEGDYVIAEEPVVADTVNLFRNKGISVACVKMDEKGMDLDDLTRLIKQYQPKFIYTMPNIHNPTAITMPIERRKALLDIAFRYGIPIIEENSLRDFRYEGTELPTLYSLDKYQSVLYIDTFTLTFLPGIKTAFVIGPSEPIEMIGRLIITSQMMIYNIGHAILNEFIEEGRFEEHVKYLQDFYRKKRDYFCRRLVKLQGKGLSFSVPQGGLFVWCKLKENINEKKLFKICKEKGVLYMPGSVYYPFGYQGSGHIRLCFSNASEEEIDMGIDILGKALDLSRAD